MLSAVANLTAAQLKRAVAIKERMEKLERELEAVIRQGVTASKVTQNSFRKRRKVSAASRAKIAAAARARWARFRAAKAK